MLRAAMLGTGVVFALYPLAPTPWLMGAVRAAAGPDAGQRAADDHVHAAPPHARRPPRRGDGVALDGDQRLEHGDAAGLRCRRHRAGRGGAVLGWWAARWAPGSWVARRLAGGALTSSEAQRAAGAAAARRRGGGGAGARRAAAAAAGCRGAPARARPAAWRRAAASRAAAAIRAGSRRRRGRLSSRLGQAAQRLRADGQRRHRAPADRRSRAAASSSADRPAARCRACRAAAAAGGRRRRARSRATCTA